MTIIVRENVGSVKQTRCMNCWMEDYGLKDSKPAMTPMETNYLSSLTSERMKLINNKLYRLVIFGTQVIIH